MSSEKSPSASIYGNGISSFEGAGRGIPKIIVVENIESKVILIEFEIAENKQMTTMTQVSQEGAPIVVLEKQRGKLVPESVLLAGRKCDGIGSRQHLDLCRRDANGNQTLNRLVCTGKVIEKRRYCIRLLLWRHRQQPCPYCEVRGNLYHNMI
ncbi:hypothetical protein [Rhizobium sp. SYY.PMSO]|uniref:hypothetical protein n=1 Tax=Rhizobium sp. SYY.PMSO TaxID=3382192 RepID=UPI00398FBEF6